ncbi:thioesterase family protein [Saccharicrinis sp. GN24d3]|uniref:thioesterase family protein n=1 Tax=Saccharicrinis sp. GN24d3 TaxID=3458416 RepID=UPI0040374A38
MKIDLKPGLHHSKNFHISEHDLASTLQTGDVPYAATPSLIILMERVICEMIAGRIPENYTCVSAEINVKHLMPVSAGDEILCSVHLKFSEESKLFFDFAIFNLNDDIIAIGAHERVLVKKDEY